MDVAFRVNRERVVVLGWGRAILLQLAHPLVAAAVADHSHFSADRLSRLVRLRATTGAMRAFAFGTPEVVHRTAARINAIHDRVNGRLTASGGDPGRSYSATDPTLLAWVQATLLESVPLAYEWFVGPLTPREKDEYCAASVATARLLRIPAEILPTSDLALREYMARARTSGQIRVTPTARTLARQLLYPPLLDPTRPAAWLTRLVTLGLLPPDIRSGYGFRWRPWQSTALRILASASRGMLPYVPPVLRYWPEARQ